MVVDTIRNTCFAGGVALFILTGLAGIGPAGAFAPSVDLSESELTQLFEVFDTNANGVITKPELRAVIVSFRVGLSETDLDRMMKTFDVSGDGSLQAEEFSRLMQGFRGEDNSLEAQMERAFLRFDANRDGGLDAREVRELMEASGQATTLREAKGIIFEADADGNGRIDTREFNRPADVGSAG